MKELENKSIIVKVTERDHKEIKSRALHLGVSIKRYILDCIARRIHSEEKYK